jgi:hypothetical protein
LRFWGNLTQAEIGDRLGISQMHVSRLLSYALAHLRDQLTGEQARDQFACGPGLKRHLQVTQRFVDAGFDHLVTMNAGPDPDGFIDFFARELTAPLRALTPA